MTQRIHTGAIAAVLAATFLMLPIQRAGAGDEEIDVVVNKDNPTSALDVGEAKKIFMGDKSTWSNGKRITILMLAPGQPERSVVLRDIFKMSEADYGKYFMQAAFQGKVAAPPKDIASASDMKRALAGNVGAVGYVKKSDVDDTVKVVLKLQ
jgi:ABC-type phosphate transport system substrate-binding protein